MHGVHNPSLIVDIAIFGTTLGCINLAFFQWLRSTKKSEKEKTIKKLTVWNPACSFPTLVVDNEKCIVGYKEDEIGKALGK